MLQVFQNILKNACESIKNERGKIKIRTSYNSGVRYAVSGNKTEILPLQIDIIDNGPGILADIEEQIFFPMISGRSEGSGLGLTIAQTAINGHQGIIECDSEPGRTRFSIYLPIREDYE